MKKPTKKSPPKKPTHKKAITKPGTKQTLFYDSIEVAPLIMLGGCDVEPVQPHDPLQSAVESAELAGFWIQQGDTYLAVKTKVTPALVAFLHVWAEEQKLKALTGMGLKY